WIVDEVFEDVGDLSLEVWQGARDHGQRRLGQRPVDLRFGHVREEIEGDVELPREQAAAPKLGAQTALLDQVLDEGVAIRDILEEGLGQAALALLQAA